MKEGLFSAALLDGVNCSCGGAQLKKVKGLIDDI